MKRALALAKRGRAKVWPNPMVGCVLVKNGRTIAEGWHRSYGGPHAEAEALRRAGPHARGATAYVTLEPCCEHPGKKTPPCAAALARAGIAEVVAATVDPNPAVAGRGFKFLRKAQVKTRLGPCAKQAKELNARFFSWMRHARPHVILKTALSLDGLAFTQGGKSKWITSPKARRQARQLRAGVDAVLVGVNTVLNDDPRLTARGIGRNPVRVILDSRGRTPPKAQVLDLAAPTWIFTSSRKRWQGAEAIQAPLRQGRLNLRAVLSALARRGIKTLLVEGGPTVHAAFLAERLVDEARIFLAPKLISGSSNPNAAPRLIAPKMKKVGPDFLFYGEVH